MAPIINVMTRRTDGVVAATRQYPSVLDNLEAAIPGLITYLGIAGALGVIGSLLLARRVQLQTLGLEPRESAGLVEQREALLYGIKEGVLAIDLELRVTMVNDEPQICSACRRPPPECAWQISTRTEGWPTSWTAPMPLWTASCPLRTGGHCQPIASAQRRRHIGWVATLRDRTEMLELQRELDLTRNTTGTLRAQAHEFSNRMHVVCGLIDLGKYDEMRAYVRQIEVWLRINDPQPPSMRRAPTGRACARSRCWARRSGGSWPGVRPAASTLLPPR